MDKAEVSVFIILLLDGKLGEASLAGRASKVALFAVKLKFKKSQFKTPLTVFTGTGKSCFIDIHLTWDGLIIMDSGISHKCIVTY